MTTRYKTIESPVGEVWVAWCEEGLVSIGFVDQPKGAQISESWDFDSGLRCEAIDQLGAYFTGSVSYTHLTLPTICSV